MKSRKVGTNKIVALGSDGAAAMTGKGKGVTGLLLRENPHMINVHCVAHRLAVCTSQAAQDVPALQAYQETLTSLFYYFKASSSRVSALEKIQELLESPQLKMKEVHNVRWLSFYNALDTVFRSLDPLLTYLGHADRSKDPKAIGLKKKFIYFLLGTIVLQIATQKFVVLTHFLMDVIPVVTTLNQFFQKEDIDLPLVKVSCLINTIVTSTATALTSCLPKLATKKLPKKQ
ncbi:zinc finger protein 862-like [Littorina saxatilis]|uniref:zinc finger protein 862-like n=1 Tax=Littorina saxatilis TaxID=31220 RepID=UPI0038B5CE9E